MAVVVTHRQRVLFGKRAGKSNGCEWQLPGGWIEAGERPSQAARREVQEETGLHIEEPLFVGITSNIFPDENHSISLYFEAECLDTGPLAVTEYDKCIAWHWRRWTEVTDDLYLPLRLLKQTDYRPFSTDRNRNFVSI